MLINLYLEIETLKILTKEHVSLKFPGIFSGDITESLEFLSSIGIEPLSDTEKPVLGLFQKYVSNVSQLEDLSWTQTWSIEDLPLETITKIKSEAIKRKTIEIKAKRDALKFRGIRVEENWYHTDPDSRTQWAALHSMGQYLPAAGWTTMNKTEVTLTPQLASAVFFATITLDMNCYAMAKQHIQALSVSPDPANYDYSTGWPPVFVPDES